MSAASYSATPASRSSAIDRIQSPFKLMDRRSDLASHRIEIGGVTLHLSTPDATEQEWIGQDEILRQLVGARLHHEDGFLRAFHNHLVDDAEDVAGFGVVDGAEDADAVNDVLEHAGRRERLPGAEWIPVRALDLPELMALLSQKRSGEARFTEQREVLRAIVACRTSALGGHVEGCGRCGHVRVAYNSCRNRHCP